MRDEEKQIKSKSRWQQLLRKKWVYPAIYLASAALILAGVLWYQNDGAEQADPEQPDVDADYGMTPDNKKDVVPVALSDEVLKMPVEDEKNVNIVGNFYDPDGTKEEQESALVFYNNTYRQNTGIDLAMENGKSFEAVAALSGTVASVENDDLLGNVVEVKHDNGITTHYQSLDQVAVEVGAFVKQGEPIGTAGKSVYNKDAGVHVHFEIRKDGKELNPNDYFNKPVSEIIEASEKSDKKEEPSEKPDENQADPTDGKEAEENEADDAAEEGETPAEEGDAPADEPDKSGDEGDKEEQPGDGEDSTESPGAESTDTSVGMART